MLSGHIIGQGKLLGSERLHDQEVARLVKLTAHLASLAYSTEIDECYIQKRLGHVSGEMTRRYQRRKDRFCINLTKAVGL